MVMEVEFLINLVRERPPIYDPSDRSHRDRDAIAALWKEVAAAMKCTEAECKDKWRHLRSNFMRERRKINVKPSGSANTETRRWVYYDAMQFLIPHVTPRPTSSNVPTPPDEDTCRETEDASQNSSPSVVIETPDNVSPQEAANNTETCEDRSSVNPILPKSKKTGVTKKRSRDAADEMDMRFLEELKQLREQASSQNVDDPDRQFLLSLLPMMKQLSPIDNMDIKIEIYEKFRRKLFKPAPSVQYGYWTEQNQSHTPSPCTSNVSDSYSQHEYANL
ncbi:transcription factor Adf-1-like [Macrobrachium rosenbergii]|uniref:transcription factor Adf-1-like n=1 Tax=Macrobrachium rosenbergii TaxID=79674 RepID=UPI0034D5CA9B